MAEHGPIYTQKSHSNKAKLHCFSSRGNVMYLAASILVAFAFLVSVLNPAYAEVPVSSCGILDVKGETYVLQQDLSSSGTCITITASDITLDGNGHTITGADSLRGVHIREYASGVTVQNLNISGFNTGIYVTASDAQITGNTITDMVWAGIVASNSCGVTISGNTVHASKVGIEAKYSTGIKIDSNNVDSNTQNGIRVSSVDGVIISGNTALTPGARGIILQSSNDSFIVDNIASGNEAILLHNSHNNVLINNNIESCSDCNRLYGIGVTGIMIWESNGNNIISNDIDSTHLWGIHLLGSSDNTISDNLISGHHKEIASNAYGLLISESHRNTFSYNTISDNERPYNIQDSTENKIYNNNFISNLNEGRVVVLVVDPALQYAVTEEDTSGSNVFYLDSAMGGNYWDTFDDSSEGCEDSDIDSFCDEPFVSHGTLDNFAWTVPDGWMIYSPVIPGVESFDIPEAAYCPGAEPVPTPVCEEPEVYDPDTNTCVVPEPEIPVCEEPEVYDPETNTCVVPEPEPIPEPEPEPTPIDFGLMCHIPPGNPDNAHTIMISRNAFPAHLAHGDYEGACVGDDLEVDKLSVDTENEKLNLALDILRIERENLDDTSKVGHSVSEAAAAHMLLAHEDMETKKLFQAAFLQFAKDVKNHYGAELGVSEKSSLKELDKMGLKLKTEILKVENDDVIKNKMQSSIHYINAQEKLIKIKNQIGIEKLKFKAVNEKLDELMIGELALEKKTLLFNAKMNGETISSELFKSIKKSAEQKVEENHKKNDGNGNSDDGNSNKGKGNSGKDNSGKGKSDKDKGNSGKANNGKGNSGKSGKGNNGKGKA